MVVTYNKHKAAAHQFLFSREFARSRPCLPTSYVCTYICTLVFIFFFCFHVFGRDSCVKFFLICSGVRLRERERQQVLALTPVFAYQPRRYASSIQTPSSNPNVHIYAVYTSDKSLGRRRTTTTTTQKDRTCNIIRVCFKEGTDALRVQSLHYCRTATCCLVIVHTRRQPNRLYKTLQKQNTRMQFLSMIW